MKVLIVVDMQNDFINGSLGTPEAQAIVDDVAKKISTFDGELVCLTKDTHHSNYLDTQEGKILPIQHCIKGTQGWKMNDKIATTVGYVAVDTNTNVSLFQKSTFASVELGNYLVDLSEEKGRQIEEVVLIGLCTDICVISNALLIKAFLPETKITVDAACCAGVTKESHKNALAAMKACQINVENWEG